MQMILDNWAIIGGGIILVATLLAGGWKFINTPKEEQIKKVKGWMLWAVTEAERHLGGGTGKIKLQYVYDMTVTRFPWVEKMIPFDTFSGWVDEALTEMRKQLESNQKVAEFVMNNK